MTSETEPKEAPAEVKATSTEVKVDLFEDDDEFEEFDIDIEWDDKEESKEALQQWENDWDDDDVNDDFSLPLPVSIHHRNYPPPWFSPSQLSSDNATNSKSRHRHHPLRFSVSPSSPTPFPFSHYQTQIPKEQPSDSLIEDRAIGDCLVFEEGAFEDDVLYPFEVESGRDPSPMTPQAVEDGESLVPEKWKEAVAEINLTKKEKRVISRELRFGTKLEKTKQTSGNDLEEYLTYRQMRLSQLRPLVLDNPVDLPPIHPAMKDGEKDKDFCSKDVVERVMPINPRLEVAGEGLESINEFFNCGDYVPGEVDDQKKTKGQSHLASSSSIIVYTLYFSI